MPISRTICTYLAQYKVKMELLFLFLCIIPMLLATDSPIIGILSQETYIVAKLFPNEHYDAFIAASYVKFMESSGARVMPIWIGQNETYYEWVVNSTNGLLFPGGGTYFNETHGYGEAAKFLYKFAKRANERNIYYPILGICLGMQAMMYAALDGSDIRTNCNALGVSYPLYFENDYKDSRLYSSYPEFIIDILRRKNVTYNYHRYCITKEALKETGLINDWNVLTTNNDSTGIEFISSIENIDYPFYGVQYHPEKNPFEFSKKHRIPKSLEAVQVAQCIGNFFVDEARKNNQKILDKKEDDVLMYNYSPVYTGNNSRSSYEQLYVFKARDFK